MSRFISNNHQKMPRNFNYGSSLRFAGSNALKTNMPGQHHSIAAHSARWKLFCEWAQSQGIKEAHQIKTQTLKQYADYLRARLEGQGKPLAVATAQNRLSTCNVVLRHLRNDQQVSIKPAEALNAQRHHIRTEPPQLSRDKLSAVQALLCKQGHCRISAMLGLCRELGLRTREAALLDCKTALVQANKQGEIDIVRGTKGGRGKSTSTSPSRAERWVPVSTFALHALQTAALLQADSDNLVPKTKSLPAFLSLIRYYSTPILKEQGLTNRHDLRAAYACERYQIITGYKSPVLNKSHHCPKDQDQTARAVIAEELGHHRISVVASYIGALDRKMVHSVYS